ncbi:MAG: hypothetical protein QGI37_11350, partial [Verrucomicrobiota bacterium]|nr:hypothetical protein [Verrucomicrobiota bacterium]
VRIPDVIPLMILPNFMLFLEVIISHHIFESRYRRKSNAPGSLDTSRIGRNVLSNPLLCQIVLGSLDLKTRLEKVSNFLSVEIERKK